MFVPSERKKKLKSQTSQLEILQTMSDNKKLVHGESRISTINTQTRKNESLGEINLKEKQTTALQSSLDTSRQFLPAQASSGFEEIQH